MADSGHASAFHRYTGVDDFVAAAASERFSRFAPKWLSDHAQYRQYGETPGRWMSPDPYSGSYDFSNPQSFNRYSYVLNDPVPRQNSIRGKMARLNCQVRVIGL